MLFLNLLANLVLLQPAQPEIIDRYTDRLSAFPGDSIALYVNAEYPSDRYNLKLYDLAGAEVSKTRISVFPQSKPTADRVEVGYGYRITTRIRVPDLPGGVYKWDNKIPFVIKSRDAKIIILYASNTANAYCNSGDKSLYGFSCQLFNSFRNVPPSQDRATPYLQSKVLLIFASDKRNPGGIAPRATRVNR